MGEAEEQEWYQHQLEEDKDEEEEEEQEQRHTLNVTSAAGPARGAKTSIAAVATEAAQQ